MKQNELLNKKNKKVHKILNYTEHLVILASTVTGYVSISTFASFFSWYFYRYCKFCSNNKNLHNNCRN